MLFSCDLCCALFVVRGTEYQRFWCREGNLAGVFQFTEKRWTLGKRPHFAVACSIQFQVSCESFRRDRSLEDYFRQESLHSPKIVDSLQSLCGKSRSCAFQNSTDFYRVADIRGAE